VASEPSEVIEVRRKSAEQGSQSASSFRKVLAPCIRWDAR
jgi:hypothetical protein